MAEQCKYLSPIDNWHCPEEATISAGLCIFHDPDLSKTVILLKARFEARLADEKEDPLRFDGAIFPDGISFQEVIFNRSVSFAGAEFHGQGTSFVGAEFHGQETFFAGAEFHGQETFFAGAEFHGQGETSFVGAQFRGQGTFFDVAQFHGQRTSFVGAEFHSQETSFERAQFRGKAVFRGQEPSQVFLDGFVTFESISVGEKGELVFDWVNLSRARFFYADLSRVKFLDVTWDHRPEWTIGPFQQGRWRSRAYAEALWREERRDPKNREKTDTESLSHLGRLYRALKAYYREAGEHHLVGHFHYGLMEVRWHQKRKWRKWFSWEALYRYSSGYGEDYAWAGLLLMGLLGFFAGWYWLLGIPSEMTGLPLWKQWLHAFLYSLQAGTLGRVGSYQEKIRLAARLFQAVESMVVPVQFGFFLFALRNRFRR